MQLGAVVAVRLFQLLQTRVSFSSWPSTCSLLPKRIKRQLEENGQNDDGPAPVADDALDFLQRPVDRIGKRRQPAVVTRQFEAGAVVRVWSGLRARIKRHGEGFLLARGKHALGQDHTCGINAASFAYIKLTLALPSGSQAETKWCCTIPTQPLLADFSNSALLPGCP